MARVARPDHGRRRSLDACGAEALAAHGIARLGVRDLGRCGARELARVLDGDERPRLCGQRGVEIVPQLRGRRAIGAELPQRL